MKYRISVIKRLIPLTKGFCVFLVPSFFFGIVILAINYVPQILYKVFIEDVITGGKAQMLYVVVGGYLGVFIVKTLIGYLDGFVSHKFESKLTLKLKKTILDTYWELPVGEYRLLSVSDMKMRIEDESESLLAFTRKQSINLFPFYINFFVLSIVVLIIDYRLAFFAFLCIPVTILVDTALSKREGILNAGNRQNTQRMTSWLKTSLQGWREVKAHNAQASQINHFESYLSYFASYFEKWINYWAARVLVIPKIKNVLFMKFGLYFFGGLLVLKKQLLIGDLLMFAIYYETLSNAINSISSCDAELQSERVHIDNVFELINKHTEVKKIKGNIGSINNIAFKEVCFSYPETNANVINYMSFVINKGECVGVVGRSGRGKSTLIKLITGVLRPTNGQVLISGKEMNDATFDSLNKNIACVMQDSQLINASIRDNLLFGNPLATDVDMMSACEKAGVRGFIDELPNGLETIIGEKGIKLSGGQRQRLILARIFLKNADVYIFDESTSNIDPRSEQIIQKAICEMAKNKIIIIVSHRKSMISLCDRIIDLGA